MSKEMIKKSAEAASQFVLEIVQSKEVRTAFLALVTAIVVVVRKKYKV